MRIARKRAPHGLVLLAGLLLALTACGSSGAATPCWKSVLSDWSSHTLGQTTYPIACYDQAIKNMGPDLRYYSSAPADIAAAKAKVLNKDSRRLQSHGGGSTGGGSGGGSGGSGDGGGGTSQSPASQVLGSSSVDSVPLPLMILAGLAVLLLAAGAVGIANRHLQARRVAPDEPAA